MGEMGNSTSEWWLGADRLWRKGRPPAGWEQGEDGRWHPPPPSPSEAPTEPLPVVGAATRRPQRPLRERPIGERPIGERPLHARSPERSSTVDDGAPGWLRVAIPAAVAVVVLSLIGIAVMATGGGPGGPEVDQAGAGGTSTTVGPGATTTTTGASTTSSSSPGGAASDRGSTVTTTTTERPTTTTQPRRPTTTTTTTEPDRCPDSDDRVPPCCRPDHPRPCD